jgi:hypothetical protein
MSNEWADGTLADEVGYQLTVDGPVDGIIDKDFAGDQCSFDLLDELIIPRRLVSATVLILVGWLSRVHVTLA